MRIFTKNKCLNVLGIAVLAVTIFASTLSLNANAASSSFHYAGRLIHGRYNGSYHKLDKGTVYLDVTYCLGDYAHVSLCRKTSWVYAWDKCYGTVTVGDAKKYTFPNKADANSDQYYLEITADSYTEGSGTLHN